MELTIKIRDVPDFPQEGIIFKDITPLLQDAAAFREAVDALTEHFRDRNPEVIVAVESRGFIFGATVAYKLGIGFVPARKVGKLPAAKISATYTLEYGTNTVEMHQDAIFPGQRVLVIDDLLATGGTAAATVRLVEQLGGVVVGVGFLIELTFLKGIEALEDYDVFSLIQF